jgi:hypothetical protein
VKSGKRGKEPKVAKKMKEAKAGRKRKQNEGGKAAKGREEAGVGAHHGASTGVVSPVDQNSFGRWKRAERDYARAVKGALKEPEVTWSWTTNDVAHLVSLRTAAARWCDVYFKERLGAKPSDS